jgi:orotidine-5'-phosphate decarboxylase
MTRRTGLIVALDTSDIAQATRWANAVAPHCGMVKLGLEFFLANGAAGYAAVTAAPVTAAPVTAAPVTAAAVTAAAVFLDLKLHDIPNTVAGGVRAVLPLRPRLLTLHACGGAAMIAAARAAAETAGAARPLLLAVTVLTSLDAAALHDTGVAGGTRQQVLRLARLALSAGADGLVCGPREVAMLRDALGDAPILVVPGIRPAGTDAGDQARTQTPREAAAAGADWLVVGRPITQAADPAAAAAAIAAEIAA